VSEKHSHIDQQLQNKFAEFAPMPPISWEQMEGALDNRKESKRRKLVFGWVAAAAVVSAVSVVGLFNHESANTKTATGSELTHAQTSNSNPSINSDNSGL